MSLDPTSEDAVSVLQRWEDSGAIWRVARRDGAHLEVALLTCTGGEEVDRVQGSDPDLLAFIGDRWSSEE